ncbi:hypothetical protein QL285_025767 [Trifolium repens]|nr:hypothetical protein QL285_025767 [Trifolium repens]
MSSSSFSCTNFGRSCVLQFNKVKCRCDKYAVAKVAGTDSNPLKLFYTCPEKECGFFDWAHPIGCPCQNRISGGNFDEVNQTSEVVTLVNSMEARLLAFDNDLKKTRIDLGEIKKHIEFSRNVFIAMLFFVFVIFFLLLMK